MKLSTHSSLLTDLRRRGGTEWMPICELTLPPASCKESLENGRLLLLCCRHGDNDDGNWVYHLACNTLPSVLSGSEPRTGVDESDLPKLGIVSKTQLFCNSKTISHDEEGTVQTAPSLLRLEVAQKLQYKNLCLRDYTRLW